MDAAGTPTVSVRLLASLSPEQLVLFRSYERLQEEGRDLWQATFEREITRHLVQPRCMLALLFAHLLLPSL